MNLTDIEVALLKKHVKTAKEMASVFKKTYPHLDDEAFAGDLLEHLYVLIRDGANKHDDPDMFIKACLRNKARNLVKSAYQSSKLRNVALEETHDVAISYATYLGGTEQRQYDETLDIILEKANSTQAKIIELLLEGYSLSQVAKKLGVSHHYQIRRQLDKLKKLIENPFVS